MTITPIAWGLTSSIHESETCHTIATASPYVVIRLNDHNDLLSYDVQDSLAFAQRLYASASQSIYSRLSSPHERGPEVPTKIALLHLDDTTEVYRPLILSEVKS